MKILVTGGAGYLGSVLCRSLIDEGHEVRVLDNLRSGEEGLRALRGSGSWFFFEGDCGDSQALARAGEGADAVVHLAAIVGDPACAANPDLAYRTNVTASREVIRWASESGCRIVFASTCSNYGRMTTDMPVVETSPLSPVSLYAETKVTIEKEVLQPSDSKSIATVLRFSTLFGLSPRMRFDLTANEFTRDLLGKGSIEVYGPRFWRPYIHVRDAARAIILVLSAPKELVGGEVFNVGDDRLNFRKEELALVLQRLVGMVTTIHWVEKQEDPRDYRVSFAKIRETLGFNAKKDLADLVEEIRYERKNLR